MSLHDVTDGMYSRASGTRYLAPRTQQVSLEREDKKKRGLLLEPAPTSSVISSHANMSHKKRIRFEDGNQDLRVVQNIDTNSSLAGNATSHQVVTPQHRRLKTDNIDRLQRRITSFSSSFNHILPEQQRSSNTFSYQ